jgi:N-acetylmuramoyl-L-alanine amidase
MGTMTRRLQILIDDARYAILERESQRTGRAVAELIRDAVDARYGVDRDVRQAAYAVVMAAAPMPVEEWATMKEELVDTLFGEG